ncbi:PrsW family intramembrane metalloprotease [Planosporangium sp. 12N6]|uniref:PrsW family intramembrane metalloprotease n=1 Tax=Planosporangium spinosum TaxID=3402278 RepID=UPI003CF22452
MSDLPPAGNPTPPGAYPSPGMALAAAPPPPRRLDWRRGAMLGGVIALIALSGLAVLSYVGWQIGPLALTVGIVAAILPVPLLVFCFLWLDRYEPEPVKYLAFCFGWGACVATGVALVVNTVASKLFATWGLPGGLVGVLVAPFIEETMKALGPILLFAVRRRTYSGLIDAIVYCGLSATGFAMVENILYLGGHGYAATADKNGPLAGATAVVVIFIARILMSGFAHPLFTSMTGIGLGIAARAGDRRVRWLTPLAGLIVAMMLHGTWNLMAVLTQESGQLLVMLYGYVAVMMPIFFGMVGFALWLRGAEGRLTERVVGEYVRAGWFSPPEAATLGTLGRRLAARRWAKRVAGDAGAKAMRAYQFDATRLALLRDGMSRGVGLEGAEAAETLAEERRLLAAIDAYRRVFTGRDPYASRARWDGARYQLTFPDGGVRAADAPPQPVVPVPVVLGPAGHPVPGHPAPGYPSPAQPGYGPAGYR